MIKSLHYEMALARAAMDLDIEFIENGLRVISGFPGVGKSYISSQLREHVEDLDCPGLSTDQYVTLIKDAVEADRLVLVPSWDTLRLAMDEAGIRYGVAYPMSVDAANLYAARYLNRGSSEAFVSSIMSRWDGFMESMAHDPAPLHIRLPYDATLGDVIMQSGIMEYYNGLPATQE